MGRKSYSIGPRTRQDILKGKNIRKSKDGGDNFDDYWTDESDSVSSTTSHSSISQAVRSPLKSQAVQYPLRSQAVQSPSKPKSLQSPLKLKSGHSPRKSEKMLSNNTLNSVVNVDKENSAMELEDITLNLEVKENKNNPEAEAYNKALDNMVIARNKLRTVPVAHLPTEIENSKKSKSISRSTKNVAEIKEKRNKIKESSQTVHSPLELKSVHSPLKSKKISFIKSKSISRSTRKDAKINEMSQTFHSLLKPKTNHSPLKSKKMLSLKSKSFLKSTKKAEKEKKLQYDECDEKIMRMIHGHGDEDEIVSNNQDFPDYESQHDDESFNESIESNAQSLNQDVNNSRSVPFENAPVENEEDTRANNEANEVSNHAPIRRTARKRYSPLECWRNERLLYGFKNGTVEIYGIDKGTTADNKHLQSLYKKKSQKQRKTRKPKLAEIVDLRRQKKKRVLLHKKFDLISWESPLCSEKDKNPEHSFLIKRMHETESNIFGYLQIGAGKVKPSQYIPKEDLLFTAVEGKVEVRLHLCNEVFVLDRKDMFIVPRHTPYSIKNIDKKRALLSYAVGQFKLLE